MKDKERFLDFFERKCQTDIRFTKFGGGAGRGSRYSVTEGAYVRKKGGDNLKTYRCVQGRGGVKK